MKKNKIKIFQFISRIAFLAFIILFFSAIFIKSLRPLLNGGIPVALFFIALTFECIYQLSSGFKIRKKREKEKRDFKNVPDGNYSIKDKKLNSDIGTLSASGINFLRKKFVDNGMEENDFYFDEITLDMFIKEEKPDKGLVEFLKNSLRGKDSMELHWEPK